MKVVRRGENPWVFSAISGGPNETTRHSLWSELSELRMTNSLPWMLGRDFNNIRSMAEHLNCIDNLIERYIRFNHWIENNELIDLGFAGPRFTWSTGKNLDTKKFTRLDKALCDQQWRSRFGEAAFRHLVQK